VNFANWKVNSTHIALPGVGVLLRLREMLPVTLKQSSCLQVIPIVLKLSRKTVFTMSSTVHYYPPTGTIRKLRRTVERKSELLHCVHLSASSLSVGTVVTGLDNWDIELLGVLDFFHRPEFKRTENTTFRSLICFRLQVRKKDTYSVGLLKRANLNL
jgi:hypothetical protein